MARRQIDRKGADDPVRSFLERIGLCCGIGRANGLVRFLRVLCLLLNLREPSAATYFSRLFNKPSARLA